METQKWHQKTSQNERKWQSRHGEQGEARRRRADMVDGCTHGRSNTEWARLFFKLLNKDNFAHSHNCWVHQQFCWVHLATLLWFSLLGSGGSARELM